jgi:hypothetical protein
MTMTTSAQTGGSTYPPSPSKKPSRNSKPSSRRWSAATWRSTKSIEIYERGEALKKHCEALLGLPPKTASRRSGWTGPENPRVSSRLMGNEGLPNYRAMTVLISS